MVYFDPTLVIYIPFINLDEGGEVAAVSIDLVTQLDQVAKLHVVNAYKQQAVIAKQVPRKLDPGIHEAKPIGMKPSVRFSVGH